VRHARIKRGMCSFPPPPPLAQAAVASPHIILLRCVDGQIAISPQGCHIARHPDLGPGDGVGASPVGHEKTLSATSPHSGRRQGLRCRKKAAGRRQAFVRDPRAQCERKAPGGTPSMMVAVMPSTFVRPVVIPYVIVMVSAQKQLRSAIQWIRGPFHLKTAPND
jgi:hypothetical protein